MGEDIHVSYWIATLRCIVLVLDFRLLLMQTQRDPDNVTGNWVSATHIGNLDWVSVSWPPTLAIVGICGVSQ